MTPGATARMLVRLMNDLHKQGVFIRAAWIGKVRVGLLPHQDELLNRLQTNRRALRERPRCPGKPKKRNPTNVHVP